MKGYIPPADNITGLIAIGKDDYDFTKKASTKLTEVGLPSWIWTCPLMQMGGSV